MYTDIIFLTAVGIAFLFFSDFGQSLLGKLKGLIPGLKGKINQNEESIILKRADLWEQLNDVLPDDQMAHKLMSDLWPKLIQKPKE